MFSQLFELFEFNSSNSPLSAIRDEFCLLNSLYVTKQVLMSSSCFLYRMPALFDE